MNVVAVSGRIARPVEFKKTQAGKSKARFSIAVRREYAKEGEKQADFPTIEVWGKVAERCNERLSVGDSVLVTGSLHEVVFPDEATGKHIKYYWITASKVEFISAKEAEMPEPDAEAFAEIPEDATSEAAQ